MEEYYALYKESQWFDEETMRTYQFNKFKRLLAHCYANVPFYKNIMNKGGFTPRDITSFDQLNLFPVITKEIIQKNYNSFIPENIKKIKGVKTGQTGGTTGNILFKRTDANTRSSTWAAFKRFEDWMGIRDGDKSLLLMGGHVIQSSLKDKLKIGITNYLKNSISFSPYDTSDLNINNIIQALKENQFSLIRSYSQFLFSLSQRLRQDNLSFKIKAITTTAEPLMLEHRQVFRDVFNSEVYDQYGFGEMGGVAFECNFHRGLHITEERVYVETNNKNELIITDLDNYAMPFIRYWNADEVIMSDEVCACGRKSKLLKKIMGRTCDYIMGSNNEFLHWAYFWHLFFDSNIASKRKLKKFQVVQENKDKLKIRLVAEKLSYDETNLLISNILSRIGKINVEFIYEDDIENSASGKYRPVINKLI